MLTNFPNGVSSFGVPVLGTIGGIPFTGNYYFVDPANGADGNDGTPELPLKTLYGALNKCTAGNNDVVVLMGDGSATATARLSLANAQTINSAATDGVLTWSKNATHLIGVAAPTRVAQRARIAPPSGTYTVTTFGSSTKFIDVTASGCYFANLSVFCGFSTGGASMVAWTDSGSRNCYSNVNIFGQADAASAQGTGSRSLKLSGSESTFIGCVIGGDTVTKTVANASLEFSGGATRHTFIDCTFPFMTSAATPIGIVVSAASGIDRWIQFIGCTFINAVQSTSTTMSALATLAASAGGLLLFKNPTLVGITEFGSDATSRGQIYVDGAAPTAATSGIAVNPT